MGTYRTETRHGWPPGRLHPWTNHGRRSKAHCPSETCLLIKGARKIVEEKLIDNMRYMSRNELASYVKWPDVEKAVTMMRDILPPNVSDESICKECHYIGNTLNHRSQDWSKHKNYLPKRRSRSTKIPVASQDQSEICKDEHDMEPHLSLSSTKAASFDKLAVVSLAATKWYIYLWIHMELFICFYVLLMYMYVHFLEI